MSGGIGKNELRIARAHADARRVEAERVVIARAFADKIHVRTFIQNEPRCANRIANALHTANATGAQSSAIHHEGIELHAAVAGEKAAAAGVKGFIVFHADDSGFHGVHRRAAAFQNVPAFIQRHLHAVSMGFNHVVRDGPGAAMNY